jgi:hypothetical protein
VSLNSAFIISVVVTFVVWVPLLLTVDDVCWMARLYGTTLVGCHFSDGQRGLEIAGLLRPCVICFHQIGMIASKKTAGILTICRASCVRTVCTCMCLFCFLSKNENNNAFGIIGLNSSPFDC